MPLRSHRTAPELSALVLGAVSAVEVNDDDYKRATQELEQRDAQGNNAFDRKRIQQLRKGRRHIVPTYIGPSASVGSIGPTFRLPGTLDRQAEAARNAELETRGSDGMNAFERAGVIYERNRERRRR